MKMAFKNFVCLVVLFIGIAAALSKAKDVYHPYPITSSEEGREVDEVDQENEFENDSLEDPIEKFNSGKQFISRSDYENPEVHIANYLKKRHGHDKSNVSSQETRAVNDNDDFQDRFLKNENQVKSSSFEDLESVKVFRKSRPSLADLKECLLRSNIRQAVRKNYKDILPFLSLEKNKITTSNDDDSVHEKEAPTIDEQDQIYFKGELHRIDIEDVKEPPIQIQDYPTTAYLKRPKRQISQSLGNLIQNRFINGVVITQGGTQSNYIDPWYIYNGVARANPPLTTADLYRIALVTNISAGYRRATLVPRRGSGYTSGVIVRF